MSRNNFRASGSILMKLPQTTWPEVGVITRVQLLEGPQPKIWEGQKRPNFGAIFDNFRLLSRISPELIDISNIWKKTSSINHYPFHVGRKKIGEGLSTNKKVLVAHSNQPKWTFFCTQHFGHYTVLLSHFLHSLQTDPGYLAHPPTGTGVPQKF